MIKIDMYPSPIIYDEATTEGEYFVNAISPGDDSGSSSSSSSSNSAEKKKKIEELTKHRIAYFISIFF